MAAQFIDIPLTAWRPDQGDLQHDGLAVAENVYPLVNGYSLHKKASAVSTSTIDAIARGGYGTKDNSGNANLFVGNATKLYRRTGTTFSDVSKSGGYTTATADHWEFTQYNKTLIATNYADTPQKFEIGTSSLFEDAAATAATLGTDLDGSNDYYTRGELTGLADGKEGTFSVFMRLDGRDAQVRNVFSIYHSGHAMFTVSLGFGNQISVSARNASTTTILNMQSTGTYVASPEIVHLLASWNLATGALHLYVNDADDLGTNSYTNDTIDYLDGASGTTRIGQSGGGGTSTMFEGVLGEMWFDTSYMDLSVESNRRKFVDASGRPVDLGADGSTPTGSQPLLYLSGGADDFATNLGSGGNFTKTGSPTDATIVAASSLAPKARHAGVIGDFVFLGNTNDSTNGAVPYRVQWSAIGDPDNFPTPGTTAAQDAQADEENLDPEFGEIRGIAGGKEFGLVFQESAITRFTYTGDASIFEAKTFERNRGLIAPRMFAQVGNFTYFVSKDGVYRTNGYTVDPVGEGIIDETITADIDTSNLNYCSSAVDLDKKLIYFAVSNGTKADKAYIYSYAYNKWAIVEFVDLIGDASAEVGCLVQGLTLDSTKSNRVWVLGGYDEGAGVLHKLREFTGDFAPFTLRTTVQEFPSMMYLDAASIYGDTNTTFVPSSDMPFKVYASESSDIGISDGESNTHTVTTTGAPNTRTGQVNFRICGRVAAFELASTVAQSNSITKSKVQKFRVYYQGAGA